MQRSFGLTANYVYRLRDVERNHEAYARDFKVVASPTLERLTGVPPRAAPLPRRKPPGRSVLGSRIAIARRWIPGCTESASSITRRHPWETRNAVVLTTSFRGLVNGR